MLRFSQAWLGPTSIQGELLLALSCRVGAWLGWEITAIAALVARISQQAALAGMRLDSFRPRRHRSSWSAGAGWGRVTHPYFNSTVALPARSQTAQLTACFKGAFRRLRPDAGRSFRFRPAPHATHNQPCYARAYGWPGFLLPLAGPQSGVRSRPTLVGSLLVEATTVAPVSKEVVSTLPAS